MANKASFTPDEWTKVLESVAVTGMAVTAAEPSGLWWYVEGGVRRRRCLGRGEGRSPG